MKLYLPLLMIALCPPLWAGSPKDPGVDLPGLMAEVRANNPELAAARRQLAQLEADVDINSAYPNPSIEIDKAASGATDGYELKAVQPVPLTRRAGKAAGAARTALDAARHDLEALENGLLSSARKAWYGLRIAGERRNFEEANLGFSMDLLNKIEMRLQTGEAGNSDLARAKVEVSRSSFHLQEAEAMLSAAAGELNVLMGRRPEAPLKASGDLGLAPLPPAVGPLEKYTDLALACRAELRALALKGKAAGLALDLEKDKRLPVPGLGLIHGSEDGSGYTRLFLGLELPLWYNNGGEIRKASAEKAALEAEGRRLELAIRAEVYTAWLELGLAQKRLASARETVLLLNDLRRTASQDYLAGKIDLAAFYETDRVFLEENVNYLEALDDYYERTAQMDAATNSVEGK